MAEQRKGGGRRGGTSGAKTAGRRRSGGKRAAKRVAVDHHEVEWQFEARDLDFAESWLEQHSTGTGLAVREEGTEEISDTYYDTEDWRLRRAGYALRVRGGAAGGAEATMKGLTRAGEPGGNVWRREITEPLGDEKLDTLLGAAGPVAERLRALLGGREARPLFEIRTRRKSFALRLEAPETEESRDGGADGTEEVTEDASGDVRPQGVAGDGGIRIGVVTLDRTEIPLGEGEEPVALSRVEVEAGEGTAPTPDLRGFVDELQFALGLTPTTISKYEAGVYATGLTPSAGEDLGGPTGVAPEMTVGEAAFAVLRGQFAEMRAHEPGTRLGEDPEELHDMRVATRRMRAAIKLFEDALPERTRWFRDELRNVATALGDVRDLDVQMEQLEAWRSEADEEDAEFLGKVLEILGKRRAEARRRMLQVLNSGRYERFEGSFAEMLRRGPGADGELALKNGRDPAAEPVTLAAPALLSRRYKSFAKAAKGLGEDSEPEAYHELRKKGKRLRYALEFLSGVYGGKTDALVRSLKAVQDDLGRHQDAIVAASLLHELGTNTEGPRVSRGTAFAMGTYAERYRQEAREIRAGFSGSEPYRVLAEGKAWKDLEKTMRKTGEKARSRAKDARGAGGGGKKAAKTAV